MIRITWNMTHLCCINTSKWFTWLELKLHFWFCRETIVWKIRYRWVPVTIPGIGTGTSISSNVNGTQSYRIQTYHTVQHVPVTLSIFVIFIIICDHTSAHLIWWACKSFEMVSRVQIISMMVTGRKKWCEVLFMTHRKLSEWVKEKNNKKQRIIK